MNNVTYAVLKISFIILINITKQSSGDDCLNINGNLAVSVSAFFISKNGGPVVPILKDAVVDLPNCFESTLL
jgi:hypothetical protein